MPDSWRTHILNEFLPKLYPITLVDDPDNLITEENTQQAIEQRGFKVLVYGDPIEFRYAFETQYRESWERDELYDLVIVSHESATGQDTFPYDLVAIARRLSVSLSDLFPYFNYSLIESLTPQAWDLLWQAQQQERLDSPLGETNTADFVLHHVFGIAPETIKETHHLLNMLLKRHYGEMRLPPAVERHLLQKLLHRPQFSGWPLEALLSSRAAFYTFLQERWIPYLDNLSQQLGLSTVTEDTVALAEPVLLPFDHEDVRVYMDNLFAERTLLPVDHSNANELAKQAEWIALGLKIDPVADLHRRVASLIAKLAGMIPLPDSHHSQWLEFAHRWAALNADINSSTHLPEKEKKSFLELQAQVDERFHEWIVSKYGSLHNYPPSPPVMVHHIPRFLAHQLNRLDQQKIALIVVDGLALSQWHAIRQAWQAEDPDLLFEDASLFAWIPTLTSVSRQAIFSGKLPLFFETSIATTSSEGKHWNQFWTDERFAAREVAYANTVNHDNLEPVANILSNEHVRIVGLVIDTVDKMIHGEQLGASGLQNHVLQWLQQGFLPDLVKQLIGRGFHVWITSDHGNVEATGMGRPSNEGVLADQKGQRVRVYGDEQLRLRFAQEFADSFEWSGVGLPPTFYCLLALSRTAFVGSQKKTTTHGGATIDEVIVPFISVRQVSST